MNCFIMKMKENVATNGLENRLNFLFAFSPFVFNDQTFCGIHLYHRINHINYQIIYNLKRNYKPNQFTVMYIKVLLSCL